MQHTSAEMEAFYDGIISNILEYSLNQFSPVCGAAKIWYSPKASGAYIMFLAVFFILRNGPLWYHGCDFFRYADLVSIR